MPVIRPMTAAEYAAWTQQTVPAYAAEKVASGAWAAADALDRARQEFESLLPDGQDTKDHFLYTVLSAEDTPVGVLWFAVTDRANARIAYLYNIEIFPEHRRRGHAQRALHALETEAGRLRLGGIALHVFGHNQAAQALYAKLGYLPTNINLFKALPAGA